MDRYDLRSRGAVYRLPELTMVDGIVQVAYQQLTSIVDPYLLDDNGDPVPGEMMCRLDLSYIRKQDPVKPVVAGVAPDRSGLLMCSYTSLLRAGDQIEIISGQHTGVTVEVRAIPDAAYGGVDTPDHLEVPVIEVNQLTTNVFPGGGILG